MVLVFGMMVVGCDDGSSNGEKSPEEKSNGEKSPEEKTTAERWSKWVDPESDVTLDYSVSSDGVCTITVGGTPVVEQSDRWKASPLYHYTVKKDKNYTYIFEAWTANDNRDILVQYYNDNDASVYMYKHVSLTSVRKTYTIVGEALPKGGEKFLEFQCADKLGTFYVKILSITEGGDYDYIKILSVSPSTNLTNEVEQQFTVAVEYALISQAQGEIEIFFNNLHEPNYLFSPEDGSIVVNKGKGSHTFNVTALTKDWSKLGYEEEFYVIVDLWPYPVPSDSYYSLESEYKILSFE